MEIAIETQSFHPAPSGHPQRQVTLLSPPLDLNKGRLSPETKIKVRLRSNLW